MSRYILIRGWFECDFEQVKKIKKANEEFFKHSEKYLLPENTKRLYLNGWCYPEYPINWVSVISLGVNINQIAFDYIKDMIVNVSKTERLDGYFRVNDDEDNLFLEWIVKDGYLEEIILSGS
ncbi:TPA: hypothetical protein HJT69_003992 [Escherichia coli]|nr:hypothetical protein [Escherichia coli]HAI6184354.1 hypothetical protein [Escherichia coli]HDH7541631.1 hypothetical protein [Escherichia coli]